MISEGFAVASPVAVEAQLPDPCGREADDVAILWLAEKVGDDHDVIRRAALIPTVEGDDFAFVVQVKDPDRLPAKAARETVAVESQPDQVAIEPNDAAELVALVPVKRNRVAEPPAFEEFLTLKEHGDAGLISCGTRAWPLATSSCDSL